MLTIREAVLMRRLLRVLDIGKIEELITAMEQIQGCDVARVTIIQRNRLVRFVEYTKTVE